MMPAAGTFDASSLWKAPRPLNVPLTCSNFELQRQRRLKPERSGRQLEHRCAADVRSDEAPGGLDVFAADHDQRRQAATWRR